MLHMPCCNDVSIDDVIPSSIIWSQCDSVMDLLYVMDKADFAVEV